MGVATLTSEERAIITTPEDLPILQEIKSMTLEELNQFNCYLPLDCKHYIALEKQWLETERYLIANRPGHPPEVSEEELIFDIRETRLAERFRAWYYMRFPNKVRTT
jgi:hypothetical protein